MTILNCECGNEIFIMDETEATAWQCEQCGQWYDFFGVKVPTRHLCSRKVASSCQLECRRGFVRQYRIIEQERFASKFCVLTRRRAKARYTKFPQSAAAARTKPAQGAAAARTELAQGSRSFNCAVLP